MKRVAFYILAIAAFALLGTASGTDQVPFGLAPAAIVFVGVALALAASQTMDGLAATAGAIGGFIFTALASTSAPLAGACLLALAYAERTIRVRGGSARLIHAIGALGAGAIAGGVAHTFANASLTLWIVSLAVAAVVAALPLLIDADDPLSHRLEVISKLVSAPASEALSEAATLRREADPDALDGAAARRAGRTWKSLGKLADTRAKLERAGDEGTTAERVRTMVDDRIADHVAALRKAYGAARDAKAAEVGIDDAALKDAQSLGDDLEQVAETFATGDI